MILTEAGQTCYLFVRDAFDRLADGFEAMRRHDDSGVLTVSVSPNFAAKWLVSRIGRFAEAHPDIDLRLSASMRHIDLHREDVDIAIRHGEDQWPDLNAVCLIAETLFPVCSPSLLNGPHPLKRLEDLNHHTLIHVDSDDNWRTWLGAANVKGQDQSPGLSLDLNRLGRRGRRSRSRGYGESDGCQESQCRNDLFHETYSYLRLAMVRSISSDAVMTREFIS